MALTKKDMENMGKIFATKKDLFATETKLDNKIESLESKMNAKFDNLIVGQDQIMSKIESMTMESTVSAEQYKRHDAKLENHDKRITALETQPAQ